MAPLCFDVVSPSSFFISISAIKNDRAMGCKHSFGCGYAIEILKVSLISERLSSFEPLARDDLSGAKGSNIPTNCKLN